MCEQGTLIMKFNETTFIWERVTTLGYRADQVGVDQLGRVWATSSLVGGTQLSPKAEESEIAKLLPDKKAMIVTYCAGVKCPASRMLADRLKKLGYSNVIEYPEGIAGWIAAGNAVDQKGK